MTSVHAGAVGIALERFIRQRFQVAADDTGFTRDVHLWEAGYVDSMGAIELIHHLEQTYRITLPDEVLFSESFTTIDGITAVVCALADSAAPGHPRDRPDDRVA